MSENDKSALLIINYHYVRSRDQYLYPGIHPMEWQEFTDQVQWLNDRYYMALPEDVDAFFSGRGSLPGPSVFLTFDDGLSEHGRLAKEILEPLGIRGAFFVSSQPFLDGKVLMVHKIHWLRATTHPKQFNEEFLGLLPDECTKMAGDESCIEKAARTYIYDTPEDARLKYLINFQLPMNVVDSISSEMLGSRNVKEDAFCDDVYLSRYQIEDMARTGHVIGSHGHSHTPFSNLDNTDLDIDIKKNVQFIKSITGISPQWISYPYGTDWSIPDNADELCKKYGFKIGLCLSKDRKRWNTGNEPHFLIDRINTNHVDELCGK